MGRLRDDFALLVAAGERSPLPPAALAIARIGCPELDPAPTLAGLDVLAATVRSRLVPGMSPEAAVAEVSAYLFGECGFRGNQEDYYDPRNSFLNEVVERRTGIPITLAIVLMETSARLGVRVEGVGFPGHFLVRVEGSRGPVLRDPYFGGRVVAPAELLARLKAAAAPGAAALRALPPDALEATGPLGILARMLRNLLHIYLEREDAAHALECVELLTVLAPGSTELVRVRGLLYDQLECFAAALEDLRRYLELVPDAPDRADLHARMARLARAAAAIQ